MWANAPLRPARPSTARQHRERPATDATVEPPWRALPPFRQRLAVTIFSLAALQTYAVRRHTAQSWYQSALWLRRHLALAMVNAARLYSHEAGACSTASPTTRRRVCRYRPTRLASAPGVVASFPPRSGANGSRRYPGNPNQWQVDCVLLISCHLVGVNRSSRPRETVREARPPRHLPPLLHVLDDVHRRRPPEPGQRCSRQRIPIVVVDRHRRFAVRQPPLRGARQRQRLPALVVRVVELRDIDPLRRLARQERRRAARRRAYRARGVNNSSSIPRLSRDCPLHVFRPNLSIVVMSRRLPLGFFCPSESAHAPSVGLLLAGL